MPRRRTWNIRRTSGFTGFGAVALLALMCVASCAGAEPAAGAGPDAGAAVDAAADAARVLDVSSAADSLPYAWPTGPCGHLVGETICPVTLMGYGHPTAAGTHPPFALELDLHALIQSAPTPHVLVLLGGAWCPSCKLATIYAVGNEHKIAEHVTILNVLIEGDSPKLPARKSHIDDWIKKRKIRFAIVADSYATPLAAGEALGLRESAMLVQRSTGKVLARGATLAKIWPQLAAFAPPKH